MRACIIASVLLSLFVCTFAGRAEAAVVVSEETRQNNLVSELLRVSSIAKSGDSFAITRAKAGWIFISAATKGIGTVKIVLDAPTTAEVVIDHAADQGNRDEAMRYVTKGEHPIQVQIGGDIVVEELVVKAIPELMHCGLGFDPAIKSYGHYDLEFLKKDVLPNVTTLIVRPNIELSQSIIDAWHRQGKRFVAATGINFQAKTAEEHYNYWTSLMEKTPFLDGIIIDEFIVNNPIREWLREVTPERQLRFDEERAQYSIYEAAFRRIHADQRFRDKTVYAYVGGSGKKLNQEIIGPTFVHSILDCNFRIGLERYIFEVSSEQKSKDALQSFVDGIADWVAKEPTVREQMVLTFGLFSMPPGGINKQPNVDYHVWMDQQMNVVANHPVMAGMAGLNWWTSLQADEETVRFVGKLYRHYAIEGKKELLTTDPLFLTHVQNADFEKGTDGWTLHSAEDGTIAAKSFPRYGRIEGRYMGLGRPADPEHIGDTFLWMKRSEKGPNTFSQTINNLEPGRLYSLKMFSCDYNDLINPKKKTVDEANKFSGRVTLEGVEVDANRSFAEMYASSPEPPIPVWITYHWKVFRAVQPTATLIVSDWPNDKEASGTFGQEQIFNFWEIQPYHE